MVGVSGAGAPDCCSSHLTQIESFFSGTMMIGPVAPISCGGAGSSSLFRMPPGLLGARFRGSINHQKTILLNLLHTGWQNRIVERCQFKTERRISYPKLMGWVSSFELISILLGRSGLRFSCTTPRKSPNLRLTISSAHILHCVESCRALFLFRAPSNPAFHWRPPRRRRRGQNRG